MGKVCLVKKKKGEEILNIFIILLTIMTLLLSDTYVVSIFQTRFISGELSSGGGKNLLN